METGQLIAIKREILTTTSSPGWKCILDLGEKAVARMEREAIDCDDDTQGNNLRKEAKAARKFFTALCQMVETYRRVDVDTNPDDTFVTY